MGKTLFIDAHPDLAKEWYFPYNNVLELFLETISEKSQEWVYWKCQECGSIYRMSPGHRVEKKERKKTSCFRCRGRVQAHSFTV